jgi:hypothetical protein
MLFGVSRLRRFSDAPLAHLIGTPAKRATEIGAPSLKHPFARVFPAIVATSPLANLKWCNADPFDQQEKILAISTTPAFLEAATSSRQAFARPSFTQLLTHFGLKIA